MADHDYAYAGAFRRALGLQKQVLEQLRADVTALSHADPRLAPMLRVFNTMADNATAALDNLLEITPATDPETMAYLDSLAERGGTNPLSEAYLHLPPAETPHDLKKKNGSGKEAVATLGKVLDLASGLPVIGQILGIVSKILNIVSQFLEGEASATESERQIEEKLHQLGERLGHVITGEPIPVGPGTTYTPGKPPVKVELEDIERALSFIMDLPAGEPIPGPPPEGTQPVSLTLIKQKLDNFADRLGEILVGRRIPIEPNETVERPPPHPIKTELIDIEKKLDFIMDLPEGEPIPPPPPEGTQPVSLAEIKLLISLLIELVSYAIDLPQGAPPPPRTVVGEPVSLTDIEKKLDFIMDFEPGEGRQIPLPPPGVQPVSLTQINSTVKKIYVAAENTFAAAAAGDARTVPIRATSAPPNVSVTPAFDVSGWLDLSALRDGDAVTVTIDVAFAGRPAVRFSRVTFSDAQARPLKHFRDFADGVEAVVGTSVDITLAQRASADNFATPVALAYQFIVESP